MDMDRIMGVITLKAPVYRQIADDPNATSTAGIIVAVVALLSGFVGGLVRPDLNSSGTFSADFVRGIVFAIVTVIVALVGWFVSSWVLAFVSKWFGGKTNTQEMLRVTGFVAIFGLVGLLSILALILPVLGCIVGIIAFVVAILQIIGYVIGVREAAEFSTGNAIITAIIVEIVDFLIVAVIGGLITGLLVGVLHLGGA